MYVNLVIIIADLSNDDQIVDEDGDDDCGDVAVSLVVITSELIGMEYSDNGSLITIKKIENRDDR